MYKANRKTAKYLYEREFRGTFMLSQLKDTLTIDSDYGRIELKPFELETDIATLFSWTSQPYAKFWGHLNSSLDELKSDYQTLIGSGHTRCYLGYVDGEVQFFLELYDPVYDDIGQHYHTEPGDIG
ncbi:MAG: acetyltransferase, partial [Cytophagales bacterium]|nr:acetyltransferase [Cytophagales bacterium]